MLLFLVVISAALAAFTYIVLSVIADAEDIIQELN